MARKEKVEVAQYMLDSNPASISRSLSDCEIIWNKKELKPGSFDGMLAVQIQYAVASGRNVVNVLDLGSGTGALLRNVVNDDDPKSSLKTTKDTLRANPFVRVRIIGLTDAESEAQFLTREKIEASPDSDPEFQNRISAETGYYSLTPKKQTLPTYLKRIGMKEVDLIISTGFFCHLMPPFFEEVIVDAANALRPASGHMLAALYYGGSLPRTREESVKIEDIRKRRREGQHVNDRELLWYARYLVLYENPLILKDVELTKKKMLDKLNTTSANLVVKYDNYVAVVDRK